MEKYNVKKALVYLFCFSSKGSRELVDREINLVGNAFRFVNCEVKTFKNKNKCEIEAFLKDVNVEEYDAFIVLFISEMTIQGRINCKDGEIISNSIVQHIVGNRCKNSLHKPIILIFHVPEIENDIEFDTDAHSTSDNIFHVKTDNVLIVTSSYRGLNDKKHQNYYIKKMCELLQSGLQINLHYLLVDLNILMKADKDKGGRNNKSPINQQIPVITSTLTKLVIFNPDKEPSREIENRLIIPCSKENLKVHIYNINQIDRIGSEPDVRNISQNLKKLLDLDVVLFTNIPHGRFRHSIQECTLLAAPRSHCPSSVSVDASNRKFTIHKTELFPAIETAGQSANWTIIMSRGEENKMLFGGTDYDLSNLNPYLADESKVNIIMTQLFKKIPQSPRINSGESEESKNYDTQLFSIEHGNVFFFHNTTYKDHLDKNKEVEKSLFIEEFFEVIRGLDFSKEYNLLDICIETSNRIAKNPNYVENNLNIPVINTTLTTHVYIKKC